MAKNIPFDSKQHRDMVTYVKSLVKLSDDKLADRIEAWRDAEKTNQSYIPAADVERKANVGTKAESTGFTQIHVPYSYAMQMAAHTYLSSVFLGRSPVFQFQGRNGQGQDQVLAAEAIVDYQLQAGGIYTKQYFWLNDILQYGVGVQSILWDEEVQSITSYEEQPILNNGVPVIGADGLPETEEKEVVNEYPGYKGHKSINTRPKDFICDPRVGWADFQNGEFCGQRTRVAWHEIMHGASRGKYFNVEALEKNPVNSKQHELEGDNPALIETSDTQLSQPMKSKDFVNLKEIYVRLVPSAWGLGSNDVPEIWVITLANDVVIIGANPSGWIHGMFPYIVQPMELDAYGMSSRGFPEIGLPLEQSMNWLVNSHMFNVEKAVNNEYIFDPTAIVTKDFLDPRPGKRIRLRPSAYGKDIRGLVHQFNQVDATRTHLQDMQVVEGLFQRVFGINDQMLGALASGRKTATEIRSASGFGLNRMKVLAEFISANGFSQLGKMLLSGSHQMYDEGMKLRIAGDLGANGSEYLQFDPASIAGEFDMVSVDGTLPVDRFAMTAMWKELIMGMQQMPQVAGRYDLAGIFAWTAKMGGLKNIDTFELKPEDNQKLMEEVQRGNMVNANEAGVADEIGRAVGGAGGGSGGVSGAPTISGVGSVG